MWGREQTDYKSAESTTRSCLLVTRRVIRICCWTRYPAPYDQ